MVGLEIIGFVAHHYHLFYPISRDENVCTLLEIGLEEDE